MKKTAVLLALSLMVFAFAPGAGAYQLENTDVYWVPGVHTDRINNDAYAQAGMLKSLGLFHGTDKGFELERTMTRAEAAVMVVRFLGAEDKVLAGTWRHPFTDVPAWADKYIGWLYESGLTKGVSSTRYGAQEKATLKQYAQFLERALDGPNMEPGSQESYGVATKDEIELWDEENNLFTHAMAVGLSVRVLGFYNYTVYGNHMSMAQFFIDKNMFTAEQFGEAAWGVLPSDYRMTERDGTGYLTRYVADVPVSFCKMSGLSLAGSSQYSARSYLHAVRMTAEGLAEFFILDPKTLAVLASDDYDADVGFLGLDYIGTVDGTDYLVEARLNTESGNDYAGALLSWNGQTLDLLLDAQELWKNGRPPVAYQADLTALAVADAGTLIGVEGFTRSFTAGGNLLIAGADTLFYISKDGIVKSAYPAGMRILYFDGRVAVSQLVKEDATKIGCLDAATGKVLDEYTVMPDMEGDAGRRTFLRREGNYFYGEIGLYRFSDGRLYRLTDRPALALAFTRMGALATDPIILTHAPGERVYGMNAPGGNSVVMIGQNGNETVLLSNDPPHGIEIAGIYGMGSALWFYSEQGVGMQHANVYTYALLQGESGPVIHVLDYKAGRPETEAGWSEDNMTGYKAAYIEKEQARLDALRGGSDV